jgi:predicted transcriptional regulator
MTDIPIESMTPAQAGEALAKMAEAYHGTPPTDPKTPTEAQARLDALTKNKDWGDKLTAGDVTTRREFTSLTEMAAKAEHRLDNVLAGKVEPELMELTSAEHPLSTRNLASVVESFREMGLSDGTIKQAIEGGTVSKEEHGQAKQAMALLMSDAEWSKRLLSGDWSAKRDLQLLSIILNSQVGQ